MDQFDELYAISDIHLGGEKTAAQNFQIFKYGDRLAKFIQDIKRKAPNRHVALVLNGDIFDSLAERCVDGYVASTESMALEMIQRVEADSSFADVWQALSDFTQAPKRTLIMVIGNHDIELALPVVQSYLTKSLCGNRKVNQASLKFSTSGTGYTCKVGDARVFCTHGNELDAFNWVDYNGLAQLGNAMNAGRRIDVDDWKPNAGTKLVVDVMNIVKRKYPFVDVLKPEKNAIASVLLALDRDTFSKVDLRSIIPIMGKAAYGTRVKSKLLSSDLDAMADEEVSGLFMSDVIGKNLGRELSEEKAQADEISLLEDAEDYVLNGGDNNSDFGDNETLGVGSILLAKMGLMDKSKALRAALLDWIDEQQDFEIDYQDDIYKDMVERVGPDIAFTITGHTHMPRKIEMSANGWYFNTGTWIRTLRFTRECLEDEAHFEQVVWPALNKGSLEDLDTLKIKADKSSRKKTQPLLYDRTNTVHLSSSGNKTTGELYRVIDAASGIRLVKERGDKTKLS